MTKLQREDIIKYLIKIQLNFENSYVTSNELERELLVESWYEALCEYPKEICDKAVNEALKRAKYPPRLGDVTEKIEILLNSHAKTDEELWAELNGVLGKVYEVSRYLAYPQYVNWAQEKLKVIYDNLDDGLKVYVVNTSTLVELSELTPDALQFEKARFFKQMPVLRKHVADREAAKRFLSLTDVKLLPKDDKK